jgi:enamine deaminase RidA (YjgF/YER057c/UK114 family)
VQTGNLLFLTGMLPTEGRGAKFVGRVGDGLDVETARNAARLAALNALAVTRQHLGSLDKVTQVVRLGVSVATSADVRDQPEVADGASELLQDVFGKDKNPCRLVYGVASLPLGTPVELEIIFEVAEKGPAMLATARGAEQNAGRERPGRECRTAGLGADHGNPRRRQPRRSSRRLYVIDPFDFQVALDTDNAQLRKKAADLRVKRVQAERREHLTDLATTPEEQQQSAGAAKLPSSMN